MPRQFCSIEQTYESSKEPQNSCYLSKKGFNATKAKKNVSEMLDNKSNWLQEENIIF